MDVAVGSVNADAVAVSDQLCVDADGGDKATLACDDRAVGHEATDLGDQAGGADEER